MVIATDYTKGYNRALFKHWIDADKDGCDTRAEVLIEEAVTKPKVGSKCLLTGGKWLSAYDGKSVSKSSDLDVDHMVPLAEAWDSGAQAWDAKKREVYANDQTDPRHLIAVTGASNRSKSDRDPAEWMPTNKAYTCEYLVNWISIKVRWSLSVDKKEKDFITTALKPCKTTKFSVVLVK